MRPLVPILASIFFWITTPCVKSETFRRDLEHRGKRVRIVFPSELKESAETLVHLSLNSLQRAESKLQLELEGDVELYFDTLPIDHNGLTTTVPRNRILVHSEAPSLTSSIGISRHYLLETLVHEWAHLLSVQKYSGVFKPMAWILGHTSRPNGSWPRWIHEGLAVWTEETVGGRPQSGSIAFDLRQYAEASHRLKRPMLQDSDLDGQWDLQKHSAFRKAQVPYSFGYLIWKDLSSQKGPQVLSEFVSLSSSSLGISFRKTFSQMGLSLKDTFQRLQNQWAQNPPPPALGTLISSASSIRGLSTFAGRTAWIESGEDSQEVFVDASSMKEIRRTTWPYNLLRPMKIFSLSHKRWLVLVHAKSEWTQNSFHSDKSPLRMRLLYWDENLSSPSCVFPLGDRLREVHVSEDEIIWTRSLESGEYEVRSAQWEPLKCKISNENALRHPTPAFHRIASPWGTPRGRRYYQVNTPQEGEKIVEHIYRDDGSVLDVLGASNGSVFTQFQSKDAEAEEALLFERSQEFWGPLYLRKNRNGVYEAQRLPLRTGAWEAQIHPYQNQIIWIENLWTHNEVRMIEKEQFSQLEKTQMQFQWRSTAPEVALKTNPTPQAMDLEKQSPIDSIWPHFWIPIVRTNEGGWVVAGQSFYNDLSNQWSGSTLLGYASNTQRPFGTSLLSYTLSNRRAWPTLSTFLQYSPRDVSFFELNDQRIQEQWMAELAANFRFSLEQRWMGLFSVGYALNYAGRFGAFKDSYSGIPAIRLVIKNPEGVRLADYLGLLTDLPSFLYFEQRVRWFSSPEFRTELSLFGKTTSRTGIQGQIEFAHTESSNFPKSYFTWGGLAPLSVPSTDTYLNRGFPVQKFAAQQLLRINTEGILRVWNPRFTFSWNRLRVQSLDIRAIVESVSWSTLFGNRYRLGEDYATSIGSELDILGSSLHYLQYKLSLGIFRGFGDLEETRFTANFRMGLDL